MDVEAVTKRLKRIEGQVRGIIRMVEAGKTCEEILIQIGSVKSSLHKTAQFVLEEHLRQCVTDGIRRGRAEEAVRRLTPAFEQFARVG